MVEAPKISLSSKPIVVLSMMGLTTGFGLAVKPALEDRGYEVIVFHATGAGGKCLEDFVASDPDVIAVIDGSLWEIANDLFGAMSTSGPHRLIEAGKRGIPQVAVPGACSVISYRGLDLVPERYKNRKIYEHNPKATAILLNPDETRVVGKTIAEKLNRAVGPVEVVIPTHALSAFTGPEGAPLYEPGQESDKALIQALKSKLNRNIPCYEVGAHINDPEFSEAVMESFERIVRHSQ
jgi:uncharacterized protein (UPF0261 family)